MQTPPLLLAAFVIAAAGCAPHSDGDPQLDDDTPTDPSASQSSETDNQGVASISFEGRTMGTTYSVFLVNAPEGVSKSLVQTRFDQLLLKIDEQMSTYRPDSELARFNSFSSTNWFAASPELVELVGQGAAFGEHTGGALDITVDPLLRLWGFGPYPRKSAIPTMADIERVLGQCGFRKLDTRPTPPALRKRALPLSVDLSAVAAGYAVDRAAEYFESIGMENYLVDIGGELRARGQNQHGKPWSIGIEKPVYGGRDIYCVIQLTGQAVATSGDYRSYFEHDGRRYSHVLDPRTGIPIQHSLASVSVVHSSAMHADAWSTALLVLGPKEGLQMAQSNRLAALFLSRTDEGIAEQSTPEFELYRIPAE